MTIAPAPVPVQMCVACKLDGALLHAFRLCSKPEISRLLQTALALVSGTSYAGRGPLHDGRGCLEAAVCHRWPHQAGEGECKVQLRPRVCMCLCVVALSSQQQDVSHAL